jgi:trimethylamine--corrinoid protein Co-methyltransferase
MLPPSTLPYGGEKMNSFGKPEEVKTVNVIPHLLSDDEVNKIHQATLDVIENGIKVTNDEALDIFHSYGCQVDKKNAIVKIPSHIVEDAIQSIPDQFVCAGRNRENDVIIGNKQAHFTIFSGGLTYIDPYTNIRRVPIKSDLKLYIRLIDYLDEIAIANRVLTPSDVNPKVMLLHELDAALSNTSKHIVCGSGPKKIIQASIEMAAAVVGDTEALRERPLILALASPKSPLTLEEDCCDTIIEFARAGLPISMAVTVIGGVTGPMTLPGLLIVHNSDALIGIVLAQLTAKGAPVFYSNYSSVADMRTGIMRTGSSSISLMQMLTGQMASFYGIPFYTIGMAGDSNVLDYQAAMESSASGITAVLSGASVITGAGFLEAAMVFSPAKLLCDCELIKMIQEIKAGITINDERMATDLIKELGPGSNYLETDHTFRFCREQTTYDLMESQDFNCWQKSGAKDMIQRSNEKAISILENHEPDSLEGNVQIELKKIIGSTERELERVNL